MYIVKSLKWDLDCNNIKGIKIRKFTTLQFAKNYALNWLQEGEVFGIYYKGKEILNDETIEK